MSIRVRLLLSYLAMLIIPIVLSFFAVIFLGHVYFEDIRSIYNLDYRHNSAEGFKQQAAAFEEIRLTIVNNPDKLLDTNYLQQLDRKIKVINTGIVVSKNHQITYASPIIDDPQILSRLPRYGGRHHEDGPIVVGKRIFQPWQFDFVFNDNSPGSVFLIADLSPVSSLAKKFIGSLFLTVLLILILTNGLLTFFVSRSIIRPIERLKEAAQQIKEGNLNFVVTTKSNDEIGQLCRSFEEMRARLKESVEMQLQYENNRKELITSISHDLKTPVTAIKGYVEGLMDGVANTPEKKQKYIETIYRKTAEIDRLIDELFLFSKLDLKKEPFNFEKVELKQYLQDCAEELALDLDKKGIRLNYNPVGNEPLWVIADREKLKRVVNNIVDNAVKYMNKDIGIIEIGIFDVDDKFVTVQIRDNGQGIPKESLALIFDRFYRTDPSRNSTTGGSGLGLSIARYIIEEHGGRVWAESEEGQETSIFFTLKRVNNA